MVPWDESAACFRTHQSQSGTRPRESTQITSNTIIQPDRLLISGSSTQTIPHQPPVVGILGGVGAGKSSVVRAVSGLRLQIIDADRIGHSLLLDQQIQEEIRASFGSSVFSEPGKIDRSRLAERVFGNEEKEQQALQTLNSILHPRIRKEIHRQISSADSDCDLVILDAALLLESGWRDECQHLIFIDTPRDQRLQRVKDGRGWTAEDHKERESSQLPVDFKKAQADFVVDNSGSPEASADQMKRILLQILSLPNPVMDTSRPDPS